MRYKKCKKRKEKNNKVVTHQLNTNFILWIWFSKLNTTISGRASRKQHISVLCYMRPPHHCHPTILVVLSLSPSPSFGQQQTANHQARPRHMKDANVKYNAKIYIWYIVHTHTHYSRYMWKCLFHLYLSFLSFCFSSSSFLFFFSCLFVCMYFISRANIYNIANKHTHNWYTFF